MQSDFGRIIDALPGLVWTALPDGQADFLNQRWCEYTGLSTDDAIRAGWQAAVHPDDLTRMLEYWLPRVAAGEGGEVDARLRRHDGAYRWFSFRFTPVRDAAGQIVKWCGINTDVEDHRRAEEAARLHERRFRAIVEGLPAIVTLMTPEGEFAYGNQHMIDYLGAPFEVLTARPTTESFHPDDRPEVDRRWRHSVETGAPYDYEARLKGGDGVYRWFHTRGFPLRDPNGDIALWYLLQENVDDRRRAADALRASEKDARAIVDGIPGLIAVFTPDGFLEQVNQQVVAFFGKKPEELKDWANANVLHPEDVKRTLSAFGKAVAVGLPFELEVRARRFDGVYRWLESRGYPLKDTSGRIVRWYNLLIDIEDRKRVEEELKARELEQKRIIDTTPALIWSPDAKGRIEWVNQHYLDYVGMPLEEMPQKGWEIIHPDDVASLSEAWKVILTSGVPGDTEARLRRYDGEYRWFLFRANPMRDESGKIVKWYGVNTDIEDRKRAEAALQTNERNLQQIVDATPAQLWSTTPEGAATSANQYYLDYVGVPADETLGWKWLNSVHPDDREPLQSVWRGVLASGVEGQAEARLRRHDGQYRWFEFRANPMRDENGTIVKWYGISTDIEDRKRAAEGVAASERNLRQTINAIPVIAYCNRADGPNEFLNQRWHDYTGLSTEDARHGGWQSALHPDDRPRMLAKWMAFLASGESGEIEGRMRRHDGAYRWFVFRSDALRDASGKIVKWYGTCTDIEDRKRADDALRVSERNLQLTIDTTPALIWSTDPDGSTDVVSQHYLDFVGLSLQQLQGWGWTTAVHPDDLDALGAVWRGILASGSEGEAEARLRRHDGVYRWFLIRANPMRDPSGNIVKWYGVNTDIEDRKQAESELRRAHGHLTEAQRLSMTGSFTADTHRDEHVWSNELYRIFEVDPATDIKIQTIRDRTHPDDLPVLETAIQRGIDGKSDVDFGIRLMLPSGAVKHVHVVAHRIEHIVERPVFFGAIQDITEAKLAEEALRRSEAFLAQGEAVSETGNFLWRFEANEIKWSDQLYRIFEFDPGMTITLEAIAGRVHPDDIPAMEDMVARAQSAQPSEYEHRIVLPDNRIKHLHFVARPTHDHEGKPAYMGSVQDVTGRRIVEQALSNVRSELAHVSRVTSLSALTASIAHEVNQPLAGIVMNASTCLRMLASDPPNVAGARETARRTIRDGNRASEVIARLRALFAKREAAVEPVDLNEAAQEVLALSVNELRRGRVTLRQEFAGGLPQVSGDRVQLQQVILNLILNASDAMSEIQDRQRQLVIRTELDEDNVRVDVEDSGIGIDAQNASKLFDAFYTTKPSGMGIGLSVSRSIIERHQGRLWARPNQGPGATFSFSIPRSGVGETEVVRHR